MFHQLSVAVQQLRFRESQEQVTSEILNTDWGKSEETNKILEKYLKWLTNPDETEYRKTIKNYLEQTLINDTYNFGEVIDESEVAFDETKQGNPRKVFEAIYRYICENE